MSQESRDPHLFSQIDVSHVSCGEHGSGGLIENGQAEQIRLLKDLVAAQTHQNKLLQELVSLLGGQQRQRAAELGQWRQANPELAHSCRKAAEAMGRVQTEFLETLTTEVAESFDGLIEGEFMFNEFVDRFGPRMAHLNGILQVLSQLAAVPGQPGPPNPK